MRKPLLNAAGWLFPMLVALVATPLLLHALGAPRFGVWALILLIATLLPTLDLGYGVAAVRDIARSPDAGTRDALAAELLTVGLLAAAFYVMLLLLVRDPLPRWLNFEQVLADGEGRLLVTLLAGWVALGCVNSALSALPRAMERFGLLALIASGGSIVLWSGVVLLGILGKALTTLAVYAVGVQVAVLALLVVWHRNLVGRWPHPASRINRLTQSSRFASASFANSLTSLATYHADKALVSVFVGPAAAGLYVAAANVANKLLGLVAAMAAVVYPRVAALHGASDTRSAAGLYFVASRLAFTVTLALATLGLVAAERFLTLWLGAAVTPDLVLAFRLLIVGYTIAASAVVASNVLSGFGNARRGAVFAAAGGVITLVAAVALIPRWGIVGAGVAGLLGMTQAAVFDFWLSRELRAAHPELSSMHRPWVGWALAAAAAALVAWAVLRIAAGWPGLIGATVGGSAAWIGVWFGGGFATSIERELAARVLRRLGLGAA